MLDNLTKRRIDTARDILVGKMPDPKSQVEQITIALIYKFMDDMDKQSEELGGKAKFFTGEYEKYAWSKIFDPRVGGYELVILYGESIQKMNQNPNIPQLFRDIFKNAYLPYRDPETLKSFLKIIEEFEYDHSEKLGDAFEYLLSIMGSQGDAGQFRTPRNLIDFIVGVVDPCKNETILDPACGTAGFLISSFKHIRNKNKKDGRINLTPDEKKRLIENFSGYDISPDMVRLSLVNMYLHGFQNPKIYEYDTLTSEDKWNEAFDVILANPPFMSPKGGIKPHKRFSVQAKRSEVLFVDYIAEHLNPNGRAGIIVPEGIIFQSQTAYKKLRKMLIESSLYAVVSLPAGVFNPYSGVKTSILFLDRNLAKKTDKILFVKVNHDGYSLGAQRRKTKENDFPLALEIIHSFCNSCRSGNLEWTPEQTGGKEISHLVKKTKIAESGDYNLSGDRYKETVVYNGKWDFVELGEITEIITGQSPPGKYYNELGQGLPFYQGKTEFSNMYIESPKKWTTQITKVAEKGDILMSVRAPVGPVNLATQKICIGRGLTAIRANIDNVLLMYLFFLLRERKEKIVGGGGSVFDSISREQIKKIKIPLPPLEVQEQIAAELENYQKIIDGAKQVVENYKPTFKIDQKWETVRLGDVCDVTSSKRIFQSEYVSSGIPFYRTKEIVELSQNKPISLELFISEEKYEAIKRKYDVPQQGEILVSAVGTIGISWVIHDNRKFYFKDGNLLWIKNIKNISPFFLKHVMDYMFSVCLNEYIFGAAYKALTIVKLKHIQIPLPSLEIQQQIVAQIEKEQKAVDANKELIKIFENKIKDKIADVWGE